MSTPMPMPMPSPQSSRRTPGRHAPHAPHAPPPRPGKPHLAISRIVRTDGLVLLLVGVVALGVRFYSARGDLWLDEIWSVEIARGCRSIADVFAQRVDNNHLLNTLWVLLVGPDAPGLLLRAPAVLLGTGGAVCGALLARAYGRGEMIAAGVLLAVSYPLVLYGSEARGYGPAIGSALVAAWCAGRYFDATASRGRLAWGIGYAGACVAGLLAHATFLPTMAALLAYSIALSVGTPRERFGRVLLLTAVPAAAALLLAGGFYANLEIGGGDVLPLRDVLQQTAVLLIGGPTVGPNLDRGATAAALLLAVVLVLRGVSPGPAGVTSGEDSDPPADSAPPSDSEFGANPGLNADSDFNSESDSNSPSPSATLPASNRTLSARYASPSPASGSTVSNASKASKASNASDASKALNVSNPSKASSNRRSSDGRSSDDTRGASERGRPPDSFGSKGRTRVLRRPDPLAVLCATAVLLPLAMVLVLRAVAPQRVPLLYPRYFVLPLAFATLLLGVQIGRWLRRIEPGVLGGALLLAMTLAHGWCDLQLIRTGRGDYSGAVAYLFDHTAGRDVVVTSNHHFRTTLLLNYYVPRFGPTDKQMLYAQTSPPDQPPQWVIKTTSSAAASPITAPPAAQSPAAQPPAAAPGDATMPAPWFVVGNRYRYVLRRTFASVPLSGFRWDVYELAR